MHRRRFLKGAAATSAALAVPASAAAGEPPAPADEAAASAVTSEAPWPLLAPLGPGSEVGLGWRLEAMTDVERGAAVLSLTHDGGAQARVHLCSLDAEPKGLVQTTSLDLLLMNDGDGAQPTSEAIGRVVKTLAKVIRANERDGVTAPQGLLPHSLRVAYFGSRGCLT